MSKILLVEDDKDYAELLSLSLKKAGYDINFASSINEAKDRSSREVHDLILLDVMLPDGNGYEFCKQCFDTSTNIPVIMLSAIRQSEEDKILGLECGAVDYVLKSHSHKELIARIKRILVHHTSAQESDKYTLKISENIILIFDIFHQKAFVDKQQLPLTKIEFQLLYIFAKNINKTLTRNAILKKVWEFEPKQSETLKVHLYRLRKKLFKFLPKEQIDIIPVRGTGYMFVAK